MRAALDAAAAAASMGEVPVGAVVVLDGRVIATAANAPRTRHDPTAHGVSGALGGAVGASGAAGGSACVRWVPLAPGARCAGAHPHARIARLYYGAPDPKGGAVEHGPRLFAQPTVHHRPEIYPGIGEEEAARLLRDFFAVRRGEGK